MHANAAIPTFRLPPGISLAQASPWHTSEVTLESPALDVMTDLTQVKAATIRPDATLEQAEQTMIYQGVRMLFVVSDMPELEGLITSTDLRGERQMRLVHARQLRFDEMRVADVMTELGWLDAIEFGHMRSATVGNMIATLKRVGRNHLLVVQVPTSSTPLRVRGVVSRAQIERQLGTVIDITEIASNFSEVERALV
ncbi:MAG TPA: CBS domain-containing protein [Burkholderiaceae bacterium]|jgi:CBS-domain-containing membrane protein|nr:CBS domain-containing protein [Burkholderiaceae bacterium]